MRQAGDLVLIAHVVLLSYFFLVVLSSSFTALWLQCRLLVLFSGFPSAIPPSDPTYRIEETVNVLEEIDGRGACGLVSRMRGRQKENHQRCFSFCHLNTPYAVVFPRHSDFFFLLRYNVVLNDGFKHVANGQFS